MAEKKIKWTEQQRRAISARGSDVLVTASAGTGKTAVLSGRCVDIVSDKTICPDVWNILVLTFTDAAAEQMRLRIAEQLRSAFLESRSPHLRKQLLLLGGADISTIHSFCKRLITEYFYELGLDPTFRVIDDDEQKLLKTEVLEKTIDWAWQQSNLTQPLRQLLRRRDLRTNDGFLARIIATSNFLDGIVFRQKWCERAIRLAEAVNPLTADLGKKQKQIVADRLQHILAQIQYAQKLYEDENTGGNWATRWQETFVEPITKYGELLKSGAWDKFSEEIRNYQKPSRFEYKPRDVEGTIAEVIRDVAKGAKEDFEGLSELAVLNPDYLDRVGRAAGLQARVLIELVKKFGRLYGEAKKTLNCLDFADLEHYALQLLTDGNSSEDNLLPSETALALRRKFKYVFVDEYQDINPVQQAILKMLSSEGNVFVVGDVKQSIYAFRGAEPKIFLEHLTSASIDPKDASGGFRVDLNANFRSAKGILDFVNKVFGRIMTVSFANIDYDELAKLRPASKDESEGAGPGNNKPVVEFHILDEKSKEADRQNNQTSEVVDGENLNVISGRRRQAAMIARRIKQMVGKASAKAEFQIYDKQERKFRDVEYRDIVILMRSPAKRVNDYVEVLRLAGVPVSCALGAGYFEATEISDLLCLLKILDNPQRDIELAAVLRSPFFNISDSELAEIKPHSETDPQRKNFYDCVLEYSANGPEEKLADKLKGILAQIEQWRRFARRGNLADLVWQVYRQTGFLSYVSALPNGQWRRANLLKLHDRAIQFEGFASSAGPLSLRRFVEFIEKLQEAGQDWVPAEPQAQAENAVRIISVHKSKGLEFPVVFLAELDGQFNKRDFQGDFLVEAGDTLGLQIIDRDSNSRLSSLAHQVIAERKLSTALAEEMRILYVATTRARDRLILTASEKRSNCRTTICTGFLFGEAAIPDWQLRLCKSPLEWILYGLSDQKNLHDGFETGLTTEVGDDDLFDLKLYGQPELERLSGYILKLRAEKAGRVAPGAMKSRSKQTGSSQLSQVKRSLAWRYRFSDIALLPAKQSVTQLTHRGDEYLRIDYSRSLERRAPAVLLRQNEAAGAVLSADLARRPALRRKTRGQAAVVDGQLIGTATHLVIARLDLARPVTIETIEKTKEKLLADGAITEAVAEHIDTESIVGFFQTELGKAVLNAGNTIWREWPFTFAVPASEFSDSSDERRATSNELIVVQGIIDMLVKTPDGLIVIDFKTDDITAGEVSERAGLYREQLELYSRAASAILKHKLLAKWLHFLTPATKFEIK